MADYRESTDPKRKLPNWRQVKCPQCPPNDMNHVDAHVSTQLLQEVGASSIAELSDRQIHRMAANGKATIPSVCIDCCDE